MYTLGRWPNISLGLAALFLLLAPNTAGAQQRLKQSFTVGPAVLTGETNQYTLGARWDWNGTREGRYVGDRFPRALGGSFRTAGTVALEPEHNPDLLHVSANGGFFIGLREPSRETHDPNQPNIGGFDVGSVFLAARVGLESDQRFDEANGTVGGEVRYVVSRLDGLWPLMPAVHARYSAVLPLASALRDRTGIPSDNHGRFDLNTVWHVPVFRTGLTLHADLLYWNAQRREPELAALNTGDGFFSSLALGYGLDRRLGSIPIHEVFVRWSGGEQPVASADRSAWMVGIVAGRRRPSAPVLIATPEPELVVETADQIAAEVMNQQRRLALSAGCDSTQLEPWRRQAAPPLSAETRKRIAEEVSARGAQTVALCNDPNPSTVATRLERDATDSLRSEIEVITQIVQHLTEPLPDVYFDFGSTRLRSGPAMDAIQAAAQALRKQPDHALVLSGVTDEAGPSDYNLRLSRERARSVRNVLVQVHGIDPERIFVVGFGEARELQIHPRAVRHEPGAELNRRVSFQLIPREQ
jgi:outer membrane protein OmpA-like peptidoglycan-associated protein